MAESAVLDRDALHRLLADVERWIEAGAVEVSVKRTRSGGYKVLGTLAEPPRRIDETPPPP